MEQDLYVKIYLDTDRGIASLAGIVADIAGGIAAGTTVITELAEIFVMVNEDFSDGAGSRGDDAWLRYRYCLEIEPFENVDALTYKGRIAALITELRESGFRAKASCDFENELP